MCGRRQWHPTPVLLPGKSHGWRSLESCSSGVTEGRTWLNDFTFTFHFHALEKEMATLSSVLAWRILGTGEPGGLSSMGSHRVGHDWSDLAAAAAADQGWSGLFIVLWRLRVLESRLSNGRLHPRSKSCPKSRPRPAHSKTASNHCILWNWIKVLLAVSSSLWHKQM